MPRRPSKSTAKKCGCRSRPPDGRCEGRLPSAHASGRGVCPQAVPSAHPERIRDMLGVPERIAIVLAISLGYPDSEAPVNRYRSERRDIEEFVRRIGC